MPKIPLIDIDSKNAHRIIKASYVLKIKVGGGGFCPKDLDKAKNTLAQAVHMFPAIAEQDVNRIRKTIYQVQQDGDQDAAIGAIQSAAAELLSHSLMFRFPLVGMVAESLVTFCEKITHITDLAAEVIFLHLRTLQIAIDEGPRAIREDDRAELLDGLHRACDSTLRQVLN